MGICRKRTDCRENFYDGCPCFGTGTAWKIMVHRTPYGTVRGIITETEAYMGVEDKGSHTYMGRRTERTEPMFHIGGTSYVYFIYGMYNCMNITAGEAEIPQAALIRAVEPADEASRKIMEKLRAQKLSRRKKLRNMQAHRVQAFRTRVQKNSLRRTRARSFRLPYGSIWQTDRASFASPWTLRRRTTMWTWRKARIFS